jgi:trigger factor
MPEPIRTERLKPPHRVQCTVVFTPAEEAAAQVKALDEFSRQLKLPGFRPGKAPADMVKDQIEPGRLLEETVRHLLPDAFQQITETEHIHPIIPPQVEAIERSPLTVRITFVEKPAVTLKGIDKIRIAKREPKADDQDVNRMVDYVLRQHQTTAIADRPAQNGDRVTIDFHATDESGAEVSGTRAAGHHVINGSKTQLPGFEDELTGLKAGDEKTFPLTFPADGPAEHLRGKLLNFHVHLQQVESVETPALTDEFAKEKLGAASAAAFREQIGDTMRRQEEGIDRKRRESELLDAIRGATKVELGPELEAGEIRALYEELEEQLKPRGQTIADWLKQSGQKTEEAEADFRGKARKRLTLRLGLQQLVEEKGADVSEEEMKGIVSEFLAPLSEDERVEIEPSYRPGQKAYEQLRWQTRVERVLGSMLES